MMQAAVPPLENRKVRPSGDFRSGRTTIGLVLFYHFQIISARYTTSGIVRIEKIVEIMTVSTA